MLETLNKISGILAAISAVVLGWLYFIYEPPIGLGDALDALTDAPAEATQSEDAARDTLSRLNDVTRALADTAAEKGYSNLPPLLITDEPIWINRGQAESWQVAGVGHFTLGVNHTNSGSAKIRKGATIDWYDVGFVFSIPGSDCKITLVGIDPTTLAAGFRLGCP